MSINYDKIRSFVRDEELAERLCEYVVEPRFISLPKYVIKFINPYSNRNFVVKDYEIVDCDKTCKI